MSEKMLKFVNIGQQNPPKRDTDNRKEDLTRSIKNLSMEKLKNSLADVLNAEFHFAKYIVLLVITYLIGLS